MKGDFSRVRFNRYRQYTSVLTQQGRVELDSDANEQRAIDEHLRTTETLDIVGQSGAPVDAAGFEITLTAKQSLSISAGRYYVDGLLCENPAPLDYNHQPYLLLPQPTLASSLAALRKGTATAIQVYLEVWERLVTPIDDPCIREVALGEADTTLRVQTVWRVIAEEVLAQPSTPNTPVARAPGISAAAFSRLASTNLIRSSLLATLTEVQPSAPAAASAPAPTAVAAAVGTAISTFATDVANNPDLLRHLSCCDQMALRPESAAPGKMGALTGGADPNASPCLPTPSAGYRGLENQLYRVEIHRGGSAGEATFKWSRDNGSVVTAITSTGSSTVNVDSLGPDANLGFSPAQWVELTDDRNEFGSAPNQPGMLAQIQIVDATQYQITLDGHPPTLDVANGHAKLRRWDQSGPSARPDGIPLAAGTWLELENGIKVSFSATGIYTPGDYWLIPARTATGNIDWPPCDSDGSRFQAPHRTLVHRAGLACIHFKDRQFEVESCRRIFYPLVDLTPHAAPPALHVTKIGWGNDGIFTVNQLFRLGLQVAFDTEPTSLLTSANFIVEANLPLSALLAREFTSAWAGPMLFATPVFAIAGTVGHDTGTTLFTWQPPVIDPRLWLEELDELIRLAQAGDFVRICVTLKGRFIFAPSGAQTAYLDGCALGQSATAADGKTPRIDLVLPSGVGGRSSDFESWFTLVPPLEIQALDVVPPVAISIGITVPAGTGDLPTAGVLAAGVTPAAAGAATAPQPATTLRDTLAGNAGIFRNIIDPGLIAGLEVTHTTWQVTLNYAPLVDTAISLSVSGAPGLDRLISLPASVVVSARTSSQTFVVSSVITGELLRAPPQIVATLTDSGGDTSTRSQSFKTS